MNAIYRYLSFFTANRRAAAWLLVFAFILHLGFVFCNTFIADDFLQYFVLAGDERLQALGFSGSETAGSLRYALQHQFNFFDAASTAFSAQKNYGVLPWWIADNAALHLWRPLTSLTQWLDFQLWPKSLAMMHASSLLILMCAWGLLYHFYRSITAKKSVALLALLILIADVSVMFPLIWLAARNVLLVMFFLSLTLIFLQRSAENSKLILLSLLSFLAALLSAEAGVVVGGFVAAFLLFYDARSFKKRLVLLGAFIVLAVFWKLAYNAAGFGSVAVGNYIDPLQQPLHTLIHCIKFYPLLLVNVFTGIDGLVSSWPLAIFGWLLLLILMALAAKSKDKILQFTLAAVVLSLVPYIALYSSAPRFSVISHIAMALFLAQLICKNFTTFITSTWLSRGGRFLILILLVIHLPLSLLGKAAASIMASGGKAFNSDLVDKKFNGFEDFDVAGKHIIVLNSIDPFRMMFYPYRAVYHQQPLAASLRALIPAANSMSLTRIDKRHLQIRINHGLTLYGGDVDTQLIAQGEAVNNLMFEFYGFFHDGHYTMSVGQSFVFNELSLTITEVNEQSQVKAMDVELTFDGEDKRYLWLYWQWKTSNYQLFTLPKNGDTFTLNGQIH